MKSFPESFQLCFVRTSSLINESFGKVIFQFPRSVSSTEKMNRDIDLICYREFRLSKFLDQTLQQTFHLESAKLSYMTKIFLLQIKRRLIPLIGMEIIF